MSAWKKLYWIIYLLASVHPLASQSHIQRRITLSLGYDEQYNSNEGMKHLPLTTIQAYSWWVDQVAKLASSSCSRKALVIADILLHMPYLGKSLNQQDSIWLLKEKWWPCVPAYHEFGHARAMRAFAPNNFKGYGVGVNGDPQIQNSVLGYYFSSLKHLAFVEEAATYGGDAPIPHQRLLIYAGGLNNEARLSKEITDWIYRSDGHIGYFGAYLRGKICAVTYTSKTISKVIADNIGDIAHINKYYREYNTDFKLDYIQYGGLASFLLSSSTYAFLQAYWNFIQTGDPTVKTFTWNGVRLPDINFYFTRNGLSLEVITGYQFSPNLWANLGLETVYYPKFSAEFTPGVRYVFPTREYGVFDFDLGVVLNTYGHVAGQIGIEWTDPINPLTLQAKLIYHNANTYVGERNITYAHTRNHEAELMISASFNY